MIKFGVQLVTNDRIIKTVEVSEEVYKQVQDMVLTKDGKINIKRCNVETF